MKHTPFVPSGAGGVFALLRGKGGNKMSGAFETAYERFMVEQMDESKGERKRRLTEANRHAETLFAKNVWWPLFGNFRHLHAEWEVPDLRRGFRYLDYAYLLPPLQIDIEVEGFGVHAKNADRRKFADDHLRAAHLTAEEWKVLRFSYDTVKEEPQVCRQILLNIIGKWSISPEASHGVRFTEEEKLIVRYAISRQAAITPNEVCALAGVCGQTARKWLRTLVEKGAFRPAGGARRVRSYELCAEKSALFLNL